MSERNWIVRLEMREGARSWTEEQTVYARTSDDAIAVAAAGAHPTYAVRGATVKEADR